jgi:hypothetical protein
MLVYISSSRDGAPHDLHKPIVRLKTPRLSAKMSDPSIDPSLARPTSDHVHLQPHGGLLSDDMFHATYEGGPDPATYQLAAAALQNTVNDTPVDPKRGVKSKRTGPLVRKRSGWNAFYKEQFALYHANNPPQTKQNARERTGFSSYAAEMWKQLSPAQKEAYVQRASEDDALAVSRPVEKLRRKRAGLLDTLARIVAELEAEFAVESLVFWSERDVPQIQPDGSTPTINEGEAYGIIASSTGSRYIELLTNEALGPHSFTAFIQQHQPPEADDSHQNLLIGTRKRKYAGGEMDIQGGIDLEDLDPTGQLKRKSKSNISRDYHDAEFRRLLLTLLNNNLPPESQKTRLPRGFFGSYLEKNGLELVGLPEKPVEIGDSGKFGGWSADALRRNLEAVRSNRVFIRRIDGESNGIDIGDITIEEETGAGDQVEEAARILAEGAGTGRNGRGGKGKSKG